jgi:hypothetical protein
MNANPLSYALLLRSMYRALSSVLPPQQRQGANRILLSIAASPNCTAAEKQMLRLIADEWRAESGEAKQPPPLRVIQGGLRAV